MTRRRIGLVITLVLTILVAPLAANAQVPAKLTRIGLLTSAVGPSPLRDHLLQSLRDLGYLEGQNLALEERYAGGEERAPRGPCDH